MTQQQLLLILAIMELVVKRGVPAALKIIKTMEVDDPTIEDIEKLKSRVPPPDAYFRE